jgi:hypothetical protein
MTHDTTIPRSLHDEARESVKDALGTFWSGVFRDQDLVDATVESKVRSLAQLYLDVMEALSLRNHSSMPTFRREHWHPMTVRLSERNTGRGVSFGMPDKAVVGGQPEGGAYLAGEVFVVGGNAEYSKVNTYPLTAFDGCPLVGVKTCVCDSIQSPKHILVQDRDFTVADGVFVVRKAEDPFNTDGYLVLDEAGDRVAVLWLCDAEFDANNVGDFLAYPLGFDAKSTDAARRILSAAWDVVVHGVTPRYLNAALGALFDVPVATATGTVEQITAEDSDGFVAVVTEDDVYRVKSDSLKAAVKAGATLEPGDFLTDDLEVYHSLSADEVTELVASGTLGTLYLPPGSVYGVHETVVVEDRESEMEDGGWFRLSSRDSASSPFWTAVMRRTTQTGREQLFQRLSGGGSTVNPLKALGYVSLANTVLVRTSRGLCKDPCAAVVFPWLAGLIPAYASFLVIQTAAASDEMAMSDDVEASKWLVGDDKADAMGAASDDVVVTFVPLADTEV